MLNESSVDVRVLDRAGQPVIGLGAGDFRVKIGGKPLEVQSIVWVGGDDSTRHCVAWKSRGSAHVEGRRTSRTPDRVPVSERSRAFADCRSHADARRGAGVPRWVDAARSGRDPLVRFASENLDGLYRRPELDSGEC